MKQKKPRVVGRMVTGFNVLTGLAPPSAHLIYRVSWSDGTVTNERGQSLRTLPGFEHINGTKKQKTEAQKNLRVDLFEVLQAIALLLGPVKRACLTLDDKTWRL